MNNSIIVTSLLEKIAEQVDGAELYESRSQRLPVQFRAGTLESVKSVETAGRALRVIKDGRLGYSTTTDLSDDKTVVQNAFESAQFGDFAPFEFPHQPVVQPVQCFDLQVEQLDESALIALGEAVVEQVKAYDPQLQVDVSIGKRVEEVRLLNTSGLQLGDRRTMLDISIEVTRAREGDILIVYDEAASRQRQAVDGVKLAEGIVERLRWADKVVAVESKAMPVVFNLMGVPALLLPLMMGLNGRNVLLNVSPLGSKLGQPVFDERFTLNDDGRLDMASRSAPYDDEGTPTSAKSLIEQGVVRQFIYDLKTAGQAKTAPTGNGWKSDILGGGGFRTLPGVAPANWLVQPGKKSLGQILRDLDEALLVEQVIGLGQGNIFAGEFSNNVSLGYLVRKGEIVGRVKNTMIAGNVYDLLKDKLIALSNRPRWIAGMLYAPAIAVDGVSVASKS